MWPKHPYRRHGVRLVQHLLAGKLLANPYLRHVLLARPMAFDAAYRRRSTAGTKQRLVLGVIALWSEA